jgi:hypothetical protein
MIGPFKPALGGFRWVYVIIDKFSKWIEYKSLVMGTMKKVDELIDEIIHRFGLPNSIITDLGSTFTGNDFWNFCDNRGMLSSMFWWHTQGPMDRPNGQMA